MKGLGGWIGGGREAWYRCPGGGCAARLPRGTRHAHARGRPPRPWGRMRRRRHANPTLPNRGSIGRCAMGGSRKRRRRRRRTRRPAGQWRGATERGRDRQKRGVPAEAAGTGKAACTLREPPLPARRKDWSTL
ncbi:unnamed protein product [Prorocentrum cordatum]|uniref:Uncharacterized protein n=1 Tax=Prorocentrum cordatum TaxID=2364126 RepID=A0ABN9UFW1_9DINO|nr:unnamed protein product [Polarella glacialis]